MKEIKELDKQLKNAQNNLSNYLRILLPAGELLKVKRGRGVWNVELVGVDSGRHAGYFRVRSNNGKIHTFHYSQIIAIH